jgi:hypothetical protein
MVMLQRTVTLPRSREAWGDGYEYIVDHDQLRHDPVLGVLGGTLTAKRSDCAPLAASRPLIGLRMRVPVAAHSALHFVFRRRE